MFLHVSSTDFIFSKISIDTLFRINHWASNDNYIVHWPSYLKMKARSSMVFLNAWNRTSSLTELNTKWQLRDQINFTFDQKEYKIWGGGKEGAWFGGRFWPRPCDSQALSSWTSDWTLPPAVKPQSPNVWTWKSWTQSFKLDLKRI